MNNRYEALLILATKGGDDSIKETIDRLEADIKAEGGAIEAIQKMDRRQFSYAAGKLESGYYANFIFAAPAAAIEKLRGKFRLDGEVYRQYYKKLDAPKAAQAA